MANRQATTSIVQPQNPSPTNSEDSGIMSRRSTPPLVSKIDSKPQPLHVKSQKIFFERLETTNTNESQPTSNRLSNVHSTSCVKMDIPIIGSLADRRKMFESATTTSNAQVVARNRSKIVRDADVPMGKSQSPMPGANSHRAPLLSCADSVGDATHDDSCETCESSSVDGPALSDELINIRPSTSESINNLFSPRPVMDFSRFALEPLPTKDSDNDDYEPHINVTKPLSPLAGRRAMSQSNLSIQIGAGITRPMQLTLPTLSLSTSNLSIPPVSEALMQSCRELLGDVLSSHEVYAEYLDRRADRKEGSVGVILAGELVGKQQIIKVKMIITGGLASRSGRMRVGDRVLAVQNRVLYPNVVAPDEARQLLKAPSDVVTLVLARSMGFGGGMDKLNNAAVSNTLLTPLQYSQNVTQIQLDDVSCGLGFAFGGGFASADGNLPLVVKRIFEVGPAANAKPPLSMGDQVTHVNFKSVDKMTLTQVVAYTKTVIATQNSLTIGVRKRVAIK